MQGDHRGGYQKAANQDQGEDSLSRENQAKGGVNTQHREEHCGKGEAEQIRYRELVLWGASNNKQECQDIQEGQYNRREAKEWKVREERE